MLNNEKPWWSEEYGFFGNFYMEGDDSQEGYLSQNQQSLAERTIAEINGVIHLMNLKGGERILDIPCGYGRHSIELAKRHYTVVGSDLNATHLAQAQINARYAKADVTFKQENMLTIRYNEEFDALINLFYSFGFFDTDEENFQVLQNFYSALRPGGKFLMHTDVNIPRIIAGTYKSKEMRHLQSKNTLHIIDNYNLSTRRIQGQWIIIDHNNMEKVKDYSVRVYTNEEFVDLCMQAGFSNCEVYSNWKGDPYSETAEDMIIIANKQ